jgi:hypothetical protein
MMPEDLRERLPTLRVARDARSPYDNAKPVFFGHYWMTGQPVLQSGSAACVDYSAAKEGPLVAYQWDGESTLSAAHFVSVG